MIGDRPVLTDRSDDLSILSLQGKDSPRFLENLLPSLKIGSQPYDHQEQNLFGIPVRICRVHRSTDQGFDLIAPSSQMVRLWNNLLEAGKPFEARPIGFIASNIIRVEAGIPWYGFDMDEKTLPLEVGMEKNAISLTKGCYIGQESVARITYRGQVQKRLSGLLIKGDLPAGKGDRIFKDEVEIGWVTSSVPSIALHCPIALGFLRREAWDPGTTLQIGHSNSILSATVSSLPFVQSGSTFQAP
ncbi:MAG: glycine cleavage T C-terminal barrel domain-containing protein [Terriglobia bacterium]